MSSYNYKSISELDTALSILPNDILLISQLNDGALITKKTTVSALLSSYDHQYLPLSGGTMTGTIKTNNTILARHLRDDSHFSIYGGTGISKGARISLAGRYHESDPGLLVLEANDGRLSTRLSLRPDGRIYIYNEEDKTYTHLVRSVNGLSANSSGNVTLASIGKLSTARTITLSGDCSGNVRFDGSSNVILNATVRDNSHNHIISNITGLSAALNGKAATDHTHDIDSINGLDSALSDELIHVSTNYLPLSGGTITGSIKVNNTTLARHLRDDSNFNIYGGTASGNGARISLAGKDHETNAGLLLLEANDGISSTRLSLRPNGQIYIYDEDTDKKTHFVRSVNGLSANSSGNVTLSSVGQLSTARTITLAGDCSGSVSFDGSENVTLNATVQNNSHTHIISNITGLSAALNGKASSSHEHVIDDISGLQNALDEKTATGHTHSIDNITSLRSTLTGKADSSHEHVIANITGLQNALDEKTATGHTHSIDNITDLQSTLAGKAESSHEHVIANITGLQESINALNRRLDAFSGFDHVISSSFGDKSFYIEYSSGLLIQSGKVIKADLSEEDKDKHYAIREIRLNKSFADANYYVALTPLQGTDGGGTIHHLAVGSRNLSSFCAMVAHTDAIGYEWLAMGKA